MTGMNLNGRQWHIHSDTNIDTVLLKCHGCGLEAVVDMPS
jgi:hypothetical protein